MTLVDTAENLDQLCDALNRVQSTLGMGSPRLANIVNLSELPRFGGKLPARSGVFSFDKTHVLVYSGRWKIQPRRI